MSSPRSHEKQNQTNYDKDAQIHGKMGLDSTLFLAYRDVPALLRKHLFEKTPKERYRFLDYGCGAGLSTELVATIIAKSGYQVDTCGVDVNTENLKLAAERMPKASFFNISKSEFPAELTKDMFDVITCNFVLLEHKEKEMADIIKAIRPLLSDSGILIVTNCNGKAYDRRNKWYSSNNDFPENESTPLPISRKLKFMEDQPVKVEVMTRNIGSSFTFFDFFHSGSAYRKAFKQAGLLLADTHKPMGVDLDGMDWAAEKECSPYKIYVLRNDASYKPDLTISDDSYDKECHRYTAKPTY